MAVALVDGVDAAVLPRALPSSIARLTQLRHVAIQSRFVASLPALPCQ